MLLNFAKAIYRAEFFIYDEIAAQQSIVNALAYFYLFLGGDHS